MTFILRSGTLVTADSTYQADILVEGEKIKAIGDDLPRDSRIEEIDASGKLVLPGGVDPHTHFDLPMFNTVSSDDHYSGHKAAAFGGTTTVIDFVPLEGGSLKESIQVWHDKVDGKAAIDFGFHMNLTQLDPRIESELEGLLHLGVPSIKVFTAYNNRLRLADALIFRAMRICRELGILTMLHAENGDVIEVLVSEALASGHLAPEWHAKTRPSWGAVDAALRGISLSAQAGGAPLYIVHMNTAGEVDMLKYAREMDLPIMGETCPQYLFFTDELYSRSDGSKWICSPPLRTAKDNERLWQGLAERTIQTIGTDHCAFFFDGTKPITYEGQKIAIPGKELGADDFTKIPNGLPGVGDRLPILWSKAVGTGRMTSNEFVAFNCTNPAKIFGIYPQKGALLPELRCGYCSLGPVQKSPVRSSSCQASHGLQLV